MLRVPYITKTTYPTPSLHLCCIHDSTFFASCTKSGTNAAFFDMNAKKDACRRLSVAGGQRLVATRVTTTDAAATIMEATMISMVFLLSVGLVLLQRLVATRATTTDAAATMIDAMMISMAGSPFLVRSGAADDGGHSDGGCGQNGSDDDGCHSFVPLSFLFAGVSCPRRHVYNTTTRFKFGRVVIFNVSFVIFASTGTFGCPGVGARMPGALGAQKLFLNQNHPLNGWFAPAL